MMMHIKSSLSKVSAVAAILSCAACGSSQESPARSASNAAASEPAISPYGEATGQNDNPIRPSREGATTASHEGTNMSSADPSPIHNESPATGSTDGSSAPGGSIETWGSGSTNRSMGVTNTMGGVDVSSLNDPQLSAVVQTINEGEIQEAELALSKSTSPEVKRFATDMMSAHRDMQNKTSALLARLRITPSDNAVSNQLKSDAQNEMSTLQTTKGKDFDRDYIDAQVRNHNEALELVDRITPIVKSPELKAMLTNAHPKLEAHLRAAERVQQSLQKGAASSQGGAKDPSPHGTAP
jgi:putative membrane protein